MSILNRFCTGYKRNLKLQTESKALLPYQVTFYVPIITYTNEWLNGVFSTVVSFCFTCDHRVHVYTHNVYRLYRNCTCVTNDAYTIMNS